MANANPSDAYPLPHNCGDHCLACMAYRHGQMFALSQLWAVYVEFSADPSVVGEDAVIRDFLQEGAKALGIRLEMNKEKAVMEEALMGMDAMGGVQ